MMKPVLWALLLAWMQSIGVLAAVTFTNIEYYIYAGSPFTVTWTGNRAPVSLALMNGPDENLKQVLSIVTDYSGQEYTWTPPAKLPADSYIFRLEDGGSTDYSARFRYPSPPLDITSTTVTGSTTTATTASETSSTTTSPTSDPSSSSSSSSEILSTPAIAIIGALGGTLLLTLIAIITYCVVRRRRKQRRRLENMPEGASFGGGMMDHDGHELVPSSAVGGGAYYHHHPHHDAAAVAGSPDTAVSGGQALHHMKVDGPGQGALYHPYQGQGYAGVGREPAELGERDMSELSSQGRYLK
ncbi:hypothetical protein N658DRAFT_489493 [Parathielavia hyrcaniae]|uniref:Yeast cell wall synthesis Kre9/Knh1-like N-terminal domain-containing protein n=1 Tax=Parathielavia hyrcaniae TaxID=113614 RepID=A0AAN6PVY8_9PEZI|nr:hypothetical protein N658DRAFT_489493 [Parathielavia hyrcaniae]